MLKHFDQLTRTETDFSQFGSGVMQLTHLLDGEGEMNQKGRVFALATLPPGAGNKLHPHAHESETWFILSGQGEFNDDGVVSTVGKGDVCHTFPGHAHALRNTGNVPMRYIVLVLYE